MSVCVVVVAFDSGPPLLGAVASALADPACSRLIVHDNGSRDGSISALRARFGADPRLEIRESATNLGFGAAVNQASSTVREPWLLILNPDCQLPAEGLSQMLRAIVDEPLVGVVGTRIRNQHGEVEAASRRQLPTLARTLWPFPVAATAGANQPVVETEALSGALMLLPTTVFRELRGFDEGYFLHCEDLDLFKRVADSGLRVLRVETVEAVHLKGYSSRRHRLRVEYYKHRGMQRYFDLHLRRGLASLAAPLVRLGIWTRFALGSPVWLARQWWAR